MNISARSMNRNLLLPVFFAGMMVAFTASDALKGLQSRFQSGGIFRAEMEHAYVDAFTGDSTVTFGSIWLAKDGYKVETSDQTIVVHNGVSNVLNRSRNQWIISTYRPEEDDFAPSRFFEGGSGSFRATDSKNGDRTLIRISFIDDFDLLRNANITLNASGLPVSIAAVDQADNRMNTTFRFGRFVADSSGVFRIQAPAGVEIIDLRDN